LELAGKEKEARLAVLQDEYKSRVEIQGKNIELEKWYQLSKNEIIKEFTDAENKLKEEQAAKDKLLRESLVADEHRFIENVKFVWSGYYDWKTERIEAEFFKNAERLDNIDAAERMYVESVKALDAEAARNKKTTADAEISAIRTKLSTMKEMNEEYFQLVRDLSVKTGEDRVDIANKYSEQTQQTWTNMFQGMSDATQAFGQQQANFYQEGANLMDSFADGLTNTFEDSFVDIVKGDYDSLGNAWDSFANDMAETFIRMIARMTIKWLIFKALQAAGGGGVASPTIGAEKGGLIPGYANGGYVMGNSGPKDNVSANLKGGEFVVRKEAVNQETMGQLRAINQNGSSANPNVTVQSQPQIVNFVDPKLLQDYISNNPDAIVNVVSSDVANAGRSRSSMRQVIR